MKPITICVALLGALFPLLQTSVRADDDILAVTQDESSMEKIIESYLKTKHRLVVNETVVNGNDLILDVPSRGDPMPKYRYAVDTQSLDKNDAGQITERGVRIQLFTDIKIAADRQPEALRIINDFSRRKVFSAIYIDTHNEIVLDWTLNVMSMGLHAEYVYDAITRMDTLWRELYPQLPADLR